LSEARGLADRRAGHPGGRAAKPVGRPVSADGPDPWLVYRTNVPEKPRLPKPSAETTALIQANKNCTSKETDEKRGRVYYRRGRK
jgi:hypothetical protein